MVPSSLPSTPQSNSIHTRSSRDDDGKSWPKNTVDIQESNVGVLDERDIEKGRKEPQKQKEDEDGGEGTYGKFHDPNLVVCPVNPLSFPGTMTDKGIIGYL